MKYNIYKNDKYIGEVTLINQQNTSLFYEEISFNELKIIKMELNEKKGEQSLYYYSLNDNIEFNKSWKIEKENNIIVVPLELFFLAKIDKNKKQNFIALDLNNWTYIKVRFKVIDECTLFFYEPVPIKVKRNKNGDIEEIYNTFTETKLLVKSEKV